MDDRPSGRRRSPDLPLETDARDPPRSAALGAASLDSRWFVVKTREIWELGW